MDELAKAALQAFVDELDEARPFGGDTKAEWREWQRSVEERGTPYDWEGYDPLYEVPKSYQPWSSLPGFAKNMVRQIALQVPSWADWPEWARTLQGAPWGDRPQMYVDYLLASEDERPALQAAMESATKIAEATDKFVTSELARVAGRAQIDAEKNAAMLAAFDDSFVSRDGLELLPDPVPLIDGLIYEATYGMLIAPSRSFKSFVALDWACSIATGSDWLGRAVSQGDVWYLVGEGAQGVKKRVRAWESLHGVRAEKLTAFTRTFDLGIEDSIPFQRFLDRAASVRPKLIVVDTLNRYAPGHDENSAAEMAIVVTNITKLVDATGAHVLLVHHTSKALDKTGRGSSSLFAAADASFFLDRPDGEGMAVTLETTKSKDDAGSDPIPLRLDACEDSLVVVLGDALESATAKADADAAAVLAAIVANPGKAFSRYYSAPEKGKDGKRKDDYRPPLLKDPKRLRAAQEYLVASGQVHRVSAGNGTVVWPGPAPADSYGFHPIPGSPK
ncbi:helicase RepA family protein [Rhodococcoides fascians]|uniref:helicase RepA family protein n=1 Tax=Rhodococcoides fascians TaxID=1828 RepID=UPI00068B3867|nr:helicase RepA family protein [Rhodococcus fascians]